LRRQKTQSIQALPEMARFDRDIFYQNYLRKSQPVVLRGFAAQWPCIEKWDLNFFSEEYGNTVSLINNNRGLVRSDEEGNFEKLLLKDYLAGLKKGSKRYLRFSPIILENTELMDDLDVPALRSASGYADPRADFQLFIGGRGTYTPLHCAFPSNLFVQIMGQKKWILYKPTNNLFLNPPASRSFYFYTGADPYANDDNEYPLFEHAEGFQVTLEPGDVLYNPPYVWHCVKNLTHSIGLGYRYNAFSEAMRSSLFMTLMTFMSFNPTIFQHMAYVRKNPGKAQLLFADEDHSVSTAEKRKI